MPAVAIISDPSGYLPALIGSALTAVLTAIAWDKWSRRPEPAVSSSSPSPGQQQPHRDGAGN